VPHILVEGSIALAELARRHAPFAARSGGAIVKCDHFYLESGGRTALVETLVSDAGHTQRFFVRLQARDDGVMVRCEPLTDPEKSPGVKRALALVASRVRAACGGRYGVTNLADYLVPEEIDGAQTGEGETPCR
jgi:hypothetical protein